MTNFLIKAAILSSFLTASTLISSPTSSRTKEVVIDEGARPAETWRTYGGVCGRDRYEVAIWLGRPLSNTLRGTKINGFSNKGSRDSTLSRWASVNGSAVDSVIDRCEPSRVRVRMSVSLATDRRNLRFYYFWLHKDGHISLIGER